MRYHSMLTCAWLYEEERGECRSRCMAGLGGTKVDQMALDWFPLSIIEQQLIILKQARISDAEAQAAFACKDFWCWSLAGSCFAGLRIIGDNNFPSLSSYFGLSASSKNHTSTSSWRQEPKSWDKLQKNTLSCGVGWEQCVAHFGCRRAQTIWNNWHKPAEPSVVRTRGKKLLKIGERNLGRNPGRNRWISMEQYKKKISAQDRKNLKSEKNRDQILVWGGILGESWNRLNRVLAFGNLERISGRGHSCKCKEVWGIVAAWGWSRGGGNAKHWEIVFHPRNSIRICEGP